MPNSGGVLPCLSVWYIMIPLEDEHDVEYSKLAAAWGVQVGWTLPGFVVV